MPVKFSHHPEDLYMEAKWTGHVTDAEIIAQITGYLNSPLYIPGTHELVDLSLADLSKVSVAALDRVAAMFSEVHRSENFERKKLAFISPNPSGFAVTNIYQTLTDATVENVKIFSDRSEAEAWLSAKDS